MNRDQLVKVLELLSSDNDGEALAAARKAHELLDRESRTWDEVIECACDGIYDLLIEVNRSLAQLSPDDQRSFIMARENYFKNGSLQDVDARRIQYFRDLIHASSSDLLEF